MTNNIILKTTRYYTKNFDKHKIIFLIHGFVYDDVWTRTNFIYDLVKFNYMCITIDMMGFGKSVDIIDDCNYTMEEHTKYIENTIKFNVSKHKKKYNIDPFIYIIGYSTGAILTLNIIKQRNINIVKCYLISLIYKYSDDNKYLKIFEKILLHKNIDDFFNFSKIFDLLNITSGNNNQMINNIKKLLNSDIKAVKKTYNNIIKNTDIDKLLDDVNREIVWIYSTNDEFIDVDEAIEKRNKYKHIINLFMIENNAHCINNTNNKFIIDVIKNNI